MKPTSLKPGDRVQFRDSRHVLRFVRREPGRPSMCIFEGAEIGTVAATDSDVVRRCERVQPEPRPRG